MKLKITRLKKQAEEGESTPKWYGLAYYDFDRNVRIFYPIPFHLIVAFYKWIRSVIKWEIAHKFMNYESKRMSDYRVKWYRAGQEDGYQKGRWARCVVDGAIELLHAEELDFIQELKEKTTRLEQIAKESQDESHNN